MSRCQRRHYIAVYGIMIARIRKLLCPGARGLSRGAKYCVLVVNCFIKLVSIGDLIYDLKRLSLQL